MDINQILFFLFFQFQKWFDYCSFFFSQSLPLNEKNCAAWHCCILFFNKIFVVCYLLPLLVALYPFLLAFVLYRCCNSLCYTFCYLPCRRRRDGLLRRWFSNHRQSWLMGMTMGRGRLMGRTISATVGMGIFNSLADNGEGEGSVSRKGRVFTISFSINNCHRFLMKNKS